MRWMWVSESRSPGSNNVLFLLRTQIVRMLIIMNCFWTSKSLFVRDVCKDYAYKEKANITCIMCMGYGDRAPRSPFKGFVAQLLRMLLAQSGIDSLQRAPLTQGYALPWVARIYWLTDGGGINVLVISAFGQPALSDHVSSRSFCEVIHVCSWAFITA